MSLSRKMLLVTITKTHEHSRSHGELREYLPCLQLTESVLDAEVERDRRLPS